MKYAIVGGCVAPAELAPVLDLIQQTTGCAYESIYRGSDAATELHSLGKHTQAEIYEEYLRGEEPNPANPPGRSTHELKSDGVPYPGPIGRSLSYWQCGMDVDDAHVAAFIAEAKSRGFVAFRPYQSGSEYHHVNFAREPRIPNPFLPLVEGSRGVFVYVLQGRLDQCGYHEVGHRGGLLKRWGHFDVATLNAVKRFQQDEHLSADGVCGSTTWLTLKHTAAAAARRQKR